MKIKGVGVDIVEIARIEKAISSQHFLERVYSVAERDYASGKHNPYSTYAGIYAVKEAAVKAIGGNIIEYEVLHNDDKKPYINGVNAHVSISHDGDYAIAFVVAYDD